METFLGLVAKDLLARVQSFERLVMVFPNKRASLFMTEELMKLAERPIWMPEIITIDEFVDRHTNLLRVDEVECVVKLYKIFRRFEPELELGEFYYWGKMLLADFDDVDKYLVNAKDLFGNVDMYRAMDDTSLTYLDSEQRALLQRFFDIVAESKSSETREFGDLWNNISTVYSEFKSLLRSEGKAYAGMAQRTFVEQELWPEVEHIAFVGFNALNRCEKSIFKHYDNNGEAIFYWDYDTLYLENPYHEAGYYMRDNLKSFPNALGAEHFNRLNRENDLKITVIDVPNVISQTKLLPELLSADSGRETAVILCDEALMIPAKNSFPAEIESINITMGFPAKSSSVVSLVEQLYALIVYGVGQDSIYYKPVVALLQHPLVCGANREECMALIAKINNENLYRVPLELFGFNQLCSTIFSGVKESVAEWLKSILQLLLLEPSLKERELDREVLFKLYTYIQRLDNLFVQEGIAEQVMEDSKFYMSLLNKMLGYVSIPFSGQPLQGVQLMGMMESRMLDFENVILMSMNEGIMPKGGVAPSFIPVSFRRAFGMPVPEHQDAMFAYYFYRLLQRTKHATMLYVSGKGNGMGSEMSRFILQLRYESKIPIEWKSLQNRLQVADKSVPEVMRSPDMLEKLKSRYRTPERGMLSPSAISSYILCPLNFFRQYILGLKEPDSVGDELDARTIGNYLHNAAEIVYTHLNKVAKGGFIQKSMIDDVLNDTLYIENVMEQAYCNVMNPHGGVVNAADGLNSGMNLIAKITVERYLRDILRYDRDKVCPFKVVKLEERVVMPFTLDDGSIIYIGGIVDRIDQLLNGTYRVIDYKTGSDKRIFESLDSLFEVGGEKHEKVPFQTMLYAMAYMKQAGLEHAALVPGVYLLREMTDSSVEFDYRFSMGAELIESFTQPLRDIFMAKLKTVVQDIYREEGKVGVSDNQCSCKYCLFKALCGVE